MCGVFLPIAIRHAKYTPHADVFWEKRYSYLAAINENLFTWHSFVTIFELALLFALYYMLWKKMNDKPGPSGLFFFLYPLRCYLTIVIFSFTAATWINAVVVKGIYFVPSGLLFSVLLFLMLPIIFILIAEPYEKSRIRFTMIELAVIFGIMAVGWLLPQAITGVFSSRTIGDYIVSVAMVYIFGYYTAELVCIPCEISSLDETASQIRRFIITLRNIIITYLIWLFVFLYIMTFVLWPLFGSLLVPFLYGGIYVIINIIQITSTNIAKDFNSASISLMNAISIHNNYDIFSILFSPFRLLGIYLNGMLSEIFKGSPWGFCKAISFLVSIHFINCTYRTHLQSQSKESTNSADSAGHTT